MFGFYFKTHSGECVCKQFCIEKKKKKVYVRNSIEKKKIYFKIHAHVHTYIHTYGFNESMTE